MSIGKGLGVFLAGLLLAATPRLAPGADLPRKAPPLAILMPGGTKLMLDSFKGKAVLLGFVLTTCPHCQYTTSLLKQIQLMYGSKGLQVVEAAIDQGADALVPGFIQHFQPNFPVGYVSYDTSSDFIQHNPMLIMHVPAIVFIDREGNIREQYEGDDRFFSDDWQEKNLRAHVEMLLSGVTPRKTPASKTAAKN
jgi:thiol-disulfide isomerase/thioredoxin